MNSICVNGKFLPATEWALPVDDRSYRYGDGLFETMKIRDGKILLQELHFQRLFSGIALLKIEASSHFSTGKLSKEVLQLCDKNGCSRLARVRLSVSAGQGGLYDEGRKLHYTIEAWPLGLEMEHLNSNGLVLGIFPGARKAADDYSHLKSANFLLYSMAALYAKQNKWNDALILNAKEGIADSTIANVFIIKDSLLHTPAISEACVDGVMRKLLLSKLGSWGYECRESALTTNDLLVADEIFLTNAIRGMRWVKQLEEKTYSHSTTTAIYERLQTIWK